MSETERSASIFAKGADPLPFSEAKQDALLGHLIFDPKFYIQAWSQIPPPMFVNVWAVKIMEAKNAFFQKWKRSPTELELKECFATADNGERARVYAKIAEARQRSTQYGLDLLKEELTNWIHSRIYRQHVEKSAREYNAGHFVDAYNCLRMAAKEIDQVSFGNDKSIEFGEYVQFFEEQKREVKTSLTFGSPMLDRLLYPVGEGRGGLLPGDQTVILAPTNAGKTTAMVTIARHNIFRGHPVLFVTHEGRPEDIQRKIWCATLNATTSELFALYRSEAGRKKIETYSELLKDKLVYIPLNTPGLTVEEVYSVVMRAQDKYASTHQGRGFSLVCDDYPAKLTTVLASKGNMATRSIHEYTYGYLNQMALDSKFHLLCAIQANREGNKINRKTGKEDRLLIPEDVSEAFGPMQIATNVLTLNRDPEAEARNRLTFYLAKSRSSEKGFAIVCKSDYGRSITHSEFLGSTYYKGVGTMSDQVDVLLEKHLNEAVPQELWSF